MFGAMLIDCNARRLEIVNEPTYTFGSEDNLRAYQFAKHLDREYAPTSIHGVILDGEPIAVFGDSGGCTGVHANSALVLGDNLFLAVGRHVVCLQIAPFKFEWALQTDTATCFGIHYSPLRDALISHGELEIARISKSGTVLWSSSGADIFTEGFALRQNHIEALDFNRHEYHFDYADGTLRA